MINDCVSGGFLQVYDGFPPPSPDRKPKGKLLAEKRLEDPAFDSTEEERGTLVCTLRGAPFELTVTTPGRARWLRFTDEQRVGVLDVLDSAFNIDPKIELSVGSRIVVDSYNISFYC